MIFFAPPCSCPSVPLSLLLCASVSDSKKIQWLHPVCAELYAFTFIHTTFFYSFFSLSCCTSHVPVAHIHTRSLNRRTLFIKQIDVQGDILSHSIVPLS
ncbi:hypothetical protein BKA57DRAFT_461683 [Linnemannia elongata]|nr:hypothetical protein BKA57DRAFT_461683 [Linnemannia elongata]